jgi:hypothetical protein
MRLRGGRLLSRITLASHLSLQSTAGVERPELIEVNALQIPCEKTSGRNTPWHGGGNLVAPSAARCAETVYRGGNGWL